MIPTIPTLVVEERTLLREGLASLLDGTHYKVVGTLESPGDIERERLEEPALIIVGVSAGLEKTITALRRLRHIFPEAKLFTVAEFSDLGDSQELLRNGADGCILDVTSQEVLLKTLDLALLQQRVIVLGRSGQANQQPSTPVFRQEQTSASINRGTGNVTLSRLSERERQILACLAQGESNKEIARNCCIAEATVKAHLKAILRKIAVQNRTQAAIWAIDNGLASCGRLDEGTPLLPPLSRVS